MNFLLEFNGYTLALFTTHVFVASVTLFYLLRFLIILRTSNQKLLIKLIGLASFSFILVFSLALGSIPVFYLEFATLIYAIAWFSGVTSYYFYMIAMREYLSIKSKVYVVSEKVFLAALAIHFIDLFSILSSGNSFILTETQSIKSIFFQEMNYSKWPNTFGLTLAFVYGTCLVTNVVIILRNLKTKNWSEKLILIGAILSLIGLANDSILAAGIVYWGFPLSFLSSIFELTRFSNYFIEKYQSRIGKLERDLLHISRAAELGYNSANIAHDTNNCLTYISLLSQIIEKELNKDEPKTEVIFDLLKKVDENTNQIIKVNKLYSSILHTGQGEISRQEIKIKHCLDLAIGQLEPTLRKNSVTLKNCVENTLKTKGNDVELFLVFSNLIKNSIQALEENETKEITIEAKRKNELIELRVIDSGNGIPEELHEKVFEPQFTTKDRSRGTGLGLSIVKELLSQNNAFIEIDKNHPNTCFVLHFQSL